MNDSLANLMKPNSIKDIIGQKHLIGENRIINNLINNKKLFSMIFYGPPGIGKTSLALAIVSDLNMRYRILNATINNKKDFDIVVEEAKMYGHIVLLMDEIHRLHKDKQDLLLPLLENGLITLIGMTTSNPYYVINPAIRSRCHIFELKELEDNDIREGLNNVVIRKILPNLVIDDDSINYIVKVSNKDLRYAYSLLEMAYYSTNDFMVTIDILQKITLKNNFYMDKDGDYHYDCLSALQKSIRGSDVDASLHYLARLILVGDLDSIYRRLSVIVYEDIGLANPSLGPKLYAAIEAAKNIGLPEARIPLGLIVIEMALSPKSNSGYSAINKAISDVESNRCDPMPEYLKNNGNDAYKYPHEYKGSYIPQRYLPNNLKHKKYYIGKEESKYEQLLVNLDKNIWKIKKDNNLV